MSNLEPKKNVPDIVIGRLPVYLRTLLHMARDNQTLTSSQELGKRLGISSAQIRKDLSHFGEFGKQGTGYRIPYLIDQLRHILKVERQWEVALVGVGDLGRALVHSNGFTDHGFRIALLFDNDPAKIGNEINGLPIHPLAELGARITERELKVAIVAVPPSAAQSVTDQLVKAGVLSILNYAPITLATPDGVRVQHIDPLVHLQRMTYYHPSDEAKALIAEQAEVDQ